MKETRLGFPLTFKYVLFTKEIQDMIPVCFLRSRKNINTICCNHRGKDVEVGKILLSHSIEVKPVKYSKAVQDSNFNIFEYVVKNQ